MSSDVEFHNRNIFRFKPNREFRHRLRDRLVAGIDVPYYNNDKKIIQEYNGSEKNSHAVLNARFKTRNIYTKFKPENLTEEDKAFIKKLTTVKFSK
jgi:hypothetical protein